MLKQIVAGLLLSAAALSSSAAPAIRLCANQWEPFTGSALPHQGVATEIVVTALARAGYRTDIQIMPWSRALTQAYQGSCDGVVGVWPTRQRQERLLLSDSYLNNALFLVYLRPELDQHSNPDTLAGMRIGVGRDYDYSDGFLARNRQQLEAVDRTRQNLLKLQVGRIDMMLEDRYAVQYLIRHSPAEYRALPALRYSPRPLLTLPLHLGLRRDYPQGEDIIAAFNLQLKAMKKDGSLAAILTNLKESP